MHQSAPFICSLFIVFFLGWPARSSASDTSETYVERFCSAREININGLSKHFYETNYSRREGWNEVNAGLGFTCHLSGLGNWNDEFELGFFENSRRRTAGYVAYGAYYPVNTGISAGVRLIVTDGYTSKGRYGIIGGPLPTLKFKLNQNLTANVSFALGAKALVFANVGIRF